MASVPQSVRPSVLVKLPQRGARPVLGDWLETEFGLVGVAPVDSRGTERLGKRLEACQN